MIVLLFIANCLWTARAKSATVDEYWFIAEGYHYLRTGEFRVGDHPPLAMILAGAALLPLHPEMPPPSADRLRWGKDFLFRNAIPADRLIFAARLPNIALAALLAVGVWGFARRIYGPFAGVMALVLCTFSPDLLAHANLATTDLPLTAFAFAAAAFLYEFRQRGTPGWLCAAGLALGLALATKLTALLFVPLAVAFLLADVPSAQRSRSARALVSAAGSAIFCLSLAVIVLLASYGVVHAWAYIEAVTLRLGQHTAGVHAYFLGEFARHGWWTYFPVAFAIKTPCGLLLLLAVALARAGRSWQATLFLATPVIALFAAGTLWGVQIGLRYLLPVYPFLFVLAGGAFAGPMRPLVRALCLAMVAWFVAASVSVAPDYLTYFNELIGGREHGPEYLLDSNIDWGQDLKELGRYLDDRGVRKVRLSYFGAEPLELRVPNAEPLGCVPVAGIAAISVNHLYGLYGDGGAEDARCYAWLRPLEPVARVGGSIWVYEIAVEPER